MKQRRSRRALVALLVAGSVAWLQPAAASAESESPGDDPSLAAAGGLRGDAARGAKLYQSYCTSCHGSGGRGDGPVGKLLDPPPADHTDSAHMGSLSDEHVFMVIKHGAATVGKSPLMAPWGGVMSDAQIRDLIAHVRSLSGT